MILFYLFFFMVFSFGLLNMIVGMVVEKTIEAWNSDDEAVQRDAARETKEAVERLKEIFLLMDENGDGKL